MDGELSGAGAEVCTASFVLLSASDLTSFDRCQCARTDDHRMQVIGLSSVR
jgi:hypothetical protein